MGVPKPIVTRTKLDFRSASEPQTKPRQFHKTVAHIHISRLKRLEMVEQGHKPALDLHHRPTNHDRLVQNLPRRRRRRQETKLDRRRRPNFLQCPGIVPFRHHRLIARHLRGPKLLPPPDRHLGRIAARVDAVSQAGQEGRVAGQTCRGRGDG